MARPTAPGYETMLLCAGLGTRLLPLTEELPKPMVPLGPQPAIAHLLEALRGAGGALRAINTHHLPDEITHFIQRYAADAHVSHEPELLGTAGGVKRALGCLAPAPLVVWNADILTQPDLCSLVQALDRARLALAVQLLPKDRGNVGMDATGRVVRLRQHRVAPEVSGGAYVGILAMRPDCFAALPERGCLIGDFAIPMLSHPVGPVAVPHRARWSDFGSIAAYRDENLLWLAEQAVDSWIAPTARVASTVRPLRSVIGSDATVNGSGPLDGVVVWPRATCTAPLSNAIVTPRAGVVRLG